MNIAVFYYICVSILLQQCLSAKLPSTIQKCEKNNNLNQCLVKSIQNTLDLLNKPIKEVGLPNLEPLEIPSMEIGAGTSAVGLKQKYKNMKIYGFTKSTCENADMDFEKNILKVDCFVPEIVLKFQYNVSGTILVLPVYGTGPGTINIEKLKFSIVFNLDEHDKNGEKHYKVVDSKFPMDPQQIRFNFENLFDGNKLLGDNINKVINENWHEIFLDVQKSYEDAFGKIFGSIFDNLLNKVPVSELFA